MRVSWDKDLTRGTTAEAWAALSLALKKAGKEPVVFSLAPTANLDGTGAAMLSVARREAAARGVSLKLELESPAHRNFLGVFEAAGPASDRGKEAPGFFLRIGTEAISYVEMFISFLVLTSDTIVFSFKGVRTRKVPLRTFLEQAVLIGYQSLGIVALIAFLVGLTTALQAAAQLKQFGADIYIANMVGLAMIVELGPLMTAILMAGRVGSSIAAEISTMVISEEMDALKTMGVNPLRYVLTPKMLAITLTQPLLTTVADLVGILGGLIVAMLYLDLSFSVFWNQLVGSVGLLDVSQGVLKSFVFAWIIGLVSAFIGFRARGGAAGVGVATTNAVVASIFLVITADAIFSIIFYFGD